MTDTPHIPRGTTPEGARSEAEASRYVREMFGRIAPRYDLLNHVLSMQIDRLWRRRVTRRLRAILDRPDALVLDLCCGTGDLSLALARAGQARVIAADFVHGMLVRAREKFSSALDNESAGASAKRWAIVEADALRLPFADSSFDLLTAAFGFRNLANYEAGLLEFLRVLKPGGAVAILDFTEPRSRLFGALYRWYFRKILPRIGGLISGDSSAYTYLPASVSKYLQPADLAALLQQSGYTDVRYEVWTGSTVALHIARRPS
jgi:demethylmenaquinone methyltransferase/2-methoxy-6-polyprenyl-1,4-benzoquinol methylase